MCVCVWVLYFTHKGKRTFHIMLYMFGLVERLLFGHAPGYSSGCFFGLRNVHGRSIGIYGGFLCCLLSSTCLGAYSGLFEKIGLKKIEIKKKKKKDYLQL